MTVIELIAKLKEYDPQTKVSCTWEGTENDFTVYRHTDGRVMINGDRDCSRDVHIGRGRIRSGDVREFLLDGGTVASGSKGLGSERCDMPDFKFFDPDKMDEQLAWLDSFFMVKV